MGVKTEVGFVPRKEDGYPDRVVAAAAEYEARFMSPFVAAERGYLDDVIMPHARRRVARVAASARQAAHEPVEEARQHPVVRITGRRRYATRRIISAATGQPGETPAAG